MKKKFAIAFIIGMIILTIVSFFTSCRSIKYVPVETVKYEYITKDSIRIDSTYVHDSVFIKMKGDTVWQYKYKFVDRYKYINLIDTVIKTDTISKVVEVEKKLTKWQSLKMDFGGGAIISLVLLILVLALYIVFRFIIKK